MLKGAIRMPALKRKLSRRASQGNLRQLTITNQLIDFASNDYLGLSRSMHLRTAVLQEWETMRCKMTTNGLGSTGSRLLTGNSHYAEQLEYSIANFHHYESSLLFGCGYLANVGLISALVHTDDIVLYDAQIHASTQDGIRLCRARAFPFRHNDLNHLENRLKTISGIGKRYVCVESIYSTDGSKALLQDICRLCTKYGARLIVDEAHAIGVFGPCGRGLVAQQQLMDEVFAQIITFGKGLGIYGAAVLGSHALKSFLLNFARSCIYTTSLPIHNLAAIKCAYDMLPSLNSERQKLFHLIALFQAHFKESSDTPIQSIKVSGNGAVRKAANNFASHGYDVRPLMSPTVRRGSESLRICLHAYNTEAEVKALITLLNQQLHHA